MSSLIKVLQLYPFKFSTVLALVWATCFLRSYSLSFNTMIAYMRELGHLEITANAPLSVADLPPLCAAKCLFHNFVAATSLYYMRSGEVAE